ncbi:hypothetical protein SAMD00023353_1700940 [Rosellinia necatrix]|uniref:Uncharacterized protein n=1 Tax=Rosellinia necatrix TaxID=77044 RepID=A0A1S8A7R3_ROSNE|nr:hypothetical protein SAMD00023353_1700940 [Rosellinia necatrix]
MFLSYGRWPQNPRVQFQSRPPTRGTKTECPVDPLISEITDTAAEFEGPPWCRDRILPRDFALLAIIEETGRSRDASPAWGTQATSESTLGLV